MADTSRRTSTPEPIPADVSVALDERGLREAYDARPAHEQSGYLGWVGKARTADVRRERLDQMLTELAATGVYLGRSRPIASGQADPDAP